MGMDGADRRPDGLALAAQTISADELDAARLGFHRTHPDRSAKRVLFTTQIVSSAALALLLAAAFSAALSVTLTVVHYAALAFFTIAILWRLIAAGQLNRPLSRLAEPTVWPIYTVLCPMYREANVVPELLAAIDALDYPKSQLDVKLLIEADDVETLTMALALAPKDHCEILLIPSAVPRTKPKALNAGLVRARGEFLVVYDAEDRPHALQLRAALAAFEDGGDRLACVQAPLAIDNADESWIARQFAAEYAIQFRELLPLLARFGLPLPLGGSSNHFRTNALREAGGWDAFNVTEDADLGYRLTRDGWRSDVIGPPTYEEAPVTFGAWLNQRTRWIKGHLQTWLVLMRDPGRTMREMGLGAFAAMQLMLGGGLLAAFAHGPLAFILMVSILSPYDLLTPADFMLATFGYCVAIFAALTASAISGELSHTRAAPTMPFYWPLASLAAYRAVFELIFRPHHWDKTKHGVSLRRAHTFEKLDQRNEESNAQRRSTSASG